METLWPAIKEPFSTSPFITAFFNEPAQKCSISNCASLSDIFFSSIRFKSFFCSLTNSLVALFSIALTGIIGNLSSNLTETCAFLASDLIKIFLKFSCAIDSVAQTNLVPIWQPDAPNCKNLRIIFFYWKCNF